MERPHKFLASIYIVLVVLFQLAKTEERSILAGAILGQVERNHGWTWNENAMSDGCFKSLTRRADGIDGKNELKIIMTESFTIVTTFIMNRAGDFFWGARRLGTSAIFAGNDMTYLSTGLKKCSSDFFDTGF